jgi:hypothetical protein
MLIDKRILAGGVALLVVGFTIYFVSSASMPVGTTGMTEDETLELLIAQQENEDVNNLAGIMIGVGFLLILVSFGARRKKRDKKGIKKIEKKPAE